MLLPWKESKNAAETTSLPLTTNGYSLSLEIMKPKYNKNLEIIFLGKWPGINPMGLSFTLAYYKKQQMFIISKLSQRTWSVQ